MERRQDARARTGPRRQGRVAAGLVLVAGLGFAGPALADGSFFQLDLSDKSTTGVLAVERGSLQFGLNRSKWNGGFHWTGRVTWKFPVKVGSVPVTFRAGPAVQYNHEDSSWDGGAAVVAESYNPTSWGSLYLLADFSTIDASYFVMSQFNHKSGFSLELAAMGNNDGYDDKTVAIDYRFRDSPVSLRVGRKIRARETFIGFSINTF
ncbi:hypothetical protein [Acidimangrovimonas sediminis]|uniref:hypothetical protein n=1 Tax=Acidimangrovimonas sediminis TaxID=2056283 RepID=UPI000C80082C|nr:hypothetical protein [Acidimangrovimonas sediminis]